MEKVTIVANLLFPAKNMLLCDAKNKYKNFYNYY